MYYLYKEKQMSIMRRYMAGEWMRSVTVAAALAAVITAGAQSTGETQEVRRWKDKVEALVDSGQSWLASRLQMRWDGKETQEYIKGEFFSHAGGEQAPRATVMLNGARSHATSYQRPDIRSLEPYGSGKPQGMWLRNNALPGKPYEWAAIAATGCMIGSINNEITGLAETAARIYDATGEEKYAAAAAEVLDTYLAGIYYKNEPMDLNHGHQQTLVGLQSFEVIHEDPLDKVTAAYGLLKPYLKKTKGDESLAMYDAALKKWADQIEANGVPHNNWNFMQARYILKVALLLDDNEAYADGKGRQHYLDRVLKDSSIRQWSLPRLAAYGYDVETGIWAECAGYSMVVLNDFTDIADIIGRELGIDLIAEIPVIAKAAEAFPQYLMPDQCAIGFGDTHPGRINRRIYERLIANAERFGKPEQKEKFSRMLSRLDADDMGEYTTQTFWAPNNSWAVSRTGMDSNRSLMAVLNGSDGNHQHANGISMELYGKGLRMAPDGGIGRTLYSGQDYLEYYSQFPAHNTVCVDGVSSYPAMKSNHPLTLRTLLPASGSMARMPVSLIDVEFVEPETQSDQRRQLVVVGDDSDGVGYFVDIFRSRRRDGKDKTHDYFYHNMGQSMTLSGKDGADLGLKPTEELAFAGAHLYAYSYLFDKQSAATDSDVEAVFTVSMPQDSGKEDVEMKMWMKGEPERTVFQALSPMTEGLSRMAGMPYDIKEQPTLTYVARQSGEAWTRPFAAVFEPRGVAAGGTVASVSYPEVKADRDGSHLAIIVRHNDGREDVVLSSDNASSRISSAGVEMKGEYAVAARDFWMLCRGTELKAPGVSITMKKPGSVIVRRNVDGTLTIEGDETAKVKVK